MSRRSSELAIERATERDDAGALDALFARHWRTLFRRARAILRDDDAAKDVVQEVFLRAIHARRELRDCRSPPAWLKRVASNLSLNYLRDATRRRRILSVALPPAAPTSDVPADASLTLRALVRGVPADLQAIALHYFVDCMSQEEIAASLGIPRRTISLRLAQFRRAALSSAFDVATA